VKTVWPFRHLGLKLLSLTIAVLLWMMVSGEETVERVIRAPLELQQIAAGIELGGDLPSTVDVRLRGASGLLSRLAPGDVFVALDLRGAKAGRRLVQLTSEQVHNPVGVEVVHISPSSLALMLEHSASRDVPVVPSVDGTPAEGYVVGRATAVPPTVEIVGPESSIRQARQAVTEPISVAGARESVSETVTVGLHDSSLRIKNPRPVTVTVEIVRAPIERSSAHN
jgi:YbbR domain-containing protein